MPTYEYHCDACGKNFEELQSILSEPIQKCTLCGEKKVHRLLGAGAGIIFRGTGFYVTDYKNKSAGENPGVKSENGGTKKEAPAHS